MTEGDGEGVSLPPSRFATRSLALFALGLFAFLFWLAIQRFAAVEEAELAIDNEAPWFAHQAEFELQRLLNALRAYALAPTAANFARARMRFDIFWSRLPPLVEGRSSRLIREASAAEVQVPAMLARLERLEPRLFELRRDPAQLAILLGELEALAPPLHQLLLDTLREDAARQETLRRRLARLSRQTWLSALGLTLSVVVLTLLLGRELRRTRALLRRSRRRERRVRHLADHDPLTEIANRRRFDARLAELLRESRHRGDGFALLLVDLDGFKRINDEHGHMVGDRLLKAAADRIASCIRRQDLLARLGGDEFGLLQIDPGNREAALRLAARLVRMLGEPFALAGREVRIGASIGIALFPAHGRAAGELYQRADLALYRAKRQGGGHIIFDARCATRAVA